MAAKRKANHLSGKQEINFVNAEQKANCLKSASASPHFMTGMTPRSLKSGRLTVPRMFAKTHLRGIKNMQLQIVEGDTWDVELKAYTNNNGSLQTFIAKGWRLFCLNNCLTEEAYCIFELVAKSLFKVHIYMSSCMESRRCSEAVLNSDYNPSKDSGFSENCDSHGSSSSSSRGVVSLSSYESSSSSSEGSSLSSEGSCFIIKGNGHSSMASSSARMKSKCKKTREGSNGGGPATRTRRASCRQRVTFCDPGAVSAPDIGVQGVDIGSQTPEVVGDSVARGTPCCDTGVAKDVSPADSEPAVPPRLVIDYELERVEGFFVPSHHTGLYTRIFNQHGHLVSNDLISSVPDYVLVAVVKALVVIGEIETCLENEVSMKRILNWETCLVAMEPIGLQVGWVLSRLKELKDIVALMDLLKEARVAAPRLAKNVESAKVKLAEAESALAANALVLNHTDKAALTSRRVFEGLL